MTALPSLVRRTDLLASGHEPHEIDGMRRSGRLRPVRRGVYLADDGEVSLDSGTAHVLAAVAACPGLADDAVFGYVTAALLLELPVWAVSLDRLHVLRSRTGGGRVRAGLHVHPTSVPEHDMVHVNGLRVTSPDRTVSDLARSLPTSRAVIIADGALHLALRAERDGVAPAAGAVTPTALADAVGRAAGRRGAPAARRVLALADGLSESPGETRSRLAFRAAGLPPPQLQWNVPGLPFRSDFGWPDRGVVGEFDGRTKYGRSLRPGDDPAEVVWREKVREDRIRGTGLTVVRWTWAELARGAGPLVGRLRAALG